MKIPGLRVRRILGEPFVGSKVVALEPTSSGEYLELVSELGGEVANLAERTAVHPLRMFSAQREGGEQK